MIVEEWQEQWDQIASTDPDNFLIDPRRLGEPTSALILAFLYARRNCPELVLPYQATEEEDIWLRQGRKLLLDWTGITSFRYPGRIFLFDSLDPLFIPLLESHPDNSAWSFSPKARLRRHVLLDMHRTEEMRQRDPLQVALAILHEETHAALDGFAYPNEDAYPPELASRFSEATVAVLELAVETSLRRKVTPRLSHLTARRADQKVILEDLYSGVEDTELALRWLSMVSTIAAEATNNLSAAQLYNHFFSRDYSVQVWLDKLNNH
jgi:hypothetical protein